MTDLAEQAVPLSDAAESFRDFLGVMEATGTTCRDTGVPASDFRSSRWCGALASVGRTRSALLAAHWFLWKMKSSFATVAICLAVSGSLPAFAASELRQCRWTGDRTPEIVQFERLEKGASEGRLSGALLRPDDVGPFPAVVLAHRVFGIEPPECYAAEQRRYLRWGYVSLLVDSNSLPRSARSDDPSTLTGYSQYDQIADVLAGARFLAQEQFVDSSRVFLIGHALAGSALLRLISAEEEHSPLAKLWIRAGARPAGIVAWHPACPSSLGKAIVPSLVLIGARDSINSARACETLARQLPRGAPVRVSVLPGAGHNFDVTWFTEYDPRTTEHAYELVRDFLER